MIITDEQLEASGVTVALLEEVKTLVNSDKVIVVATYEGPSGRMNVSVGVSANRLTLMRAIESLASTWEETYGRFSLVKGLLRLIVGLPIIGRRPATVVKTEY